MKKTKVILTIDDGPSSDMAQKVDILYQRKLPAIWFCLGCCMEKRSKDVIDAVKKGFIIGNHSYDHPKFNKLSLADIIKQIERTDKIIDSLYNQAGIKRSAKLFRFPQGIRTHGRELQLFLRREGYSQLNVQNFRIDYRYEDNLKYLDIMWTFDVMEYKVFLGDDRHPKVTKDEIIKRTDEYFNNSQLLNDQVILIHDHLKTTKIFAEIIDCLLKKNINFINICKLQKNF